MTGKVGNIVLTSVGGKVVGREYNPNVANPNTQPQQNTRSKFKLASQLSASMAPVIAIKKEGNVSARNLFVKENFPMITYSDGAASINLNGVQLTKSQRNFTGFVSDRSGGAAIAVQLKADCSAFLSRVVYIGYKKLSDGSLQFFDSKVCSTPGADGKFADVLRYEEGAVVLYAYGIKDLEAGITTKFGNMSAPSAEEVAQLLVSNSENMASVQLTKTAGLTMGEGVNKGDSNYEPTYITVAVSTQQNASVSGGGQYLVGDSVTVSTQPKSGAALSFQGWFKEGTKVSSEQTYTFTATENIKLEARYMSGD